MIEEEMSAFVAPRPRSFRSRFPFRISVPPQAPKLLLKFQRAHPREGRFVLVESGGTHSNFFREAFGLRRSIDGLPKPLGDRPPACARGSKSGNVGRVRTVVASGAHQARPGQFTVCVRRWGVCASKTRSTRLFWFDGASRASRIGKGTYGDGRNQRSNRRFSTFCRIIQQFWRIIILAGARKPLSWLQTLESDSAVACFLESDSTEWNGPADSSRSFSLSQLSSCLRPRCRFSGRMSRGKSM